jgi:phenol hydroxylase P5 protein
MVLDLAGEGFPQEAELIHGVVDLPDLYFAGLFRDLAASSGGRFTYVPALSRPAAGAGWVGEVGFVHEVLERRHPRCAGRRAYLCGPPPMIEACIRALMKGRLFERDIFTEKFVSARDGQAALAKSPLFKRI